MLLLSWLMHLELAYLEILSNVGQISRCAEEAGPESLDHGKSLGARDTESVMSPDNLHDVGGKGPLPHAGQGLGGVLRMIVGATGNATIAHLPSAVGVLGITGNENDLHGTVCAERGDGAALARLIGQLPLVVQLTCALTPPDVLVFDIVAVFEVAALVHAHELDAGLLAPLMPPGDGCGVRVEFAERRRQFKRGER